MDRREFLLTSCAAATFAIGAHGPAASEPITPTSALKTLEIRDEPFRLLQFTDIHFYTGFEDNPENALKGNIRTSDAMRRLVENTQPHLILITGDFWHENPDHRGAEFMDYAVSQVESIGLPWAYTWGNHDQLDDFSVAHRRLTDARNSLYAGSDSDGNYLLRITSHNKPVIEIFCLNTHREGAMNAERKWLAAAAGPEKDRPYRMAAMHIPIKQYAEVWENGTARGFIGEDVCFEQESGETLALFAQCGIQAVICGHDHVNDYEGAISGVRLIYGRSTGLHSYGALTLAKGGKLYTFNPETAALTWQSLPFNGKPWVPGPEERIDRRKKENT